VYLNTTERNGPLGGTASVLTIHNLGHQGIFAPSLVGDAGLPAWVFRPDGLESVGMVNFLKGAIYHATKVTTVSPTYAREILTPEGGCGLHHALRVRSPDLIGVVNGIDTEEWNPASNASIPSPFDAGHLGAKAPNKEALQQAFGLEVDPGVPLLGVVSRLYAQKGLDLLLRAIERVIGERRVQLAILGTGEAWLEEAFRAAAHRHPGLVSIQTTFSDETAHLVYAGADFLVMPSRFEPCGLSQMYAMRYGTLPIVRETGGLADTVEQYIEGEGIGTGFRFRHATAEALFDTMGWACATYYDRPEELTKLRSNAMRKDFTWDRSAGVYEDIYGWAATARAAAFE